MRRREYRFRAGLAVLLALPAAHPLLIPAIGVPSHLLWWIHVLPVALISFRHGRLPAAIAVATSGGLVAAGERLFGAGYGTPASWETVWSLTAALLATHVLVAGFALYARRTARRYQVLFDNAASAIIRTDDRGRITAANPSALRLFGCQLQDLRGRTFGEVSWLRHVPTPLALRAESWSGSIVVGGDGAERSAHVTIAAVGGQDPPGQQILIVDRTQEVAQEREMERQARLATLGATLAGVAHELRNPLQVIGGYCDLGLDPEADAASMRHALETIGGQSDRMQQLVRELLGFSRTSERPERVHLAREVRGLLRMQRVAHGQSVTIRERILWDGAADVSAAKVEQILTNLLSNAVDAGPRGRCTIEVELRSEGEDVLIEVADNGPGVDPSAAAHIFEPFVTTKAEGHGTGLGLAISRRLAVAMGGDLTVSDRATGGALFTLRLPIEGRADAGVDGFLEGVPA